MKKVNDELLKVRAQLEQASTAQATKAVNAPAEEEEKKRVPAPSIPSQQSTSQKQDQED